MGYSTDFYGGFKITPAPSPDMVKYINKFSQSRRMYRKGLGKLYGIDGEYYIHDEETGVVDYNNPPSTQPGLWCQWEIHGNKLEWDGGEKFYFYVEWLAYLIENFFDPCGYTLDGKVTWQGEEGPDKGTIRVTNNIIIVQDGIASSAENMNAVARRKIIKKCFTERYENIKNLIIYPNSRLPVDFKALLGKK